MLKRTNGHQMKMFFGTIEDLMPEDHFLRDLDELVDFSFVYERVESLYSNTGRPSIDPVLLIKMLLIGYLYGIDSERKLEKEIQVNIAYRWFLGLELEDAVPDHSTISQIRRRKWNDSNVFQEIFDEIVRKCMDAGLVSGKVLLTDSTHIRANVRNDKSEIIEVPDTPSEYMKKLDQEAYELGLIPEPVTYETDKTKEVVISPVDPDCGLMNRVSKPSGFYYLDHQTTDSDNGIITDVYVTAGNVSDSTPHTERIEAQIDKFGFQTAAICADGGYDSSEIYEAMEKRGIKTYIPKRKKPIASSNAKEGFEKECFTYDSEKNAYFCPQGKELHYSTFSKKNRTKRYAAKSKDCMNCPYREQCIGSSAKMRMIERNMHEEAREKQRKNVGTPEYYRLMRLRKIWCEGNFSHQKERHNLRRTRKWGIGKLTEQCLLSACALNLKRMVKCLKKEAAASFHTISARAIRGMWIALLVIILTLSTAPRTYTLYANKYYNISHFRQFLTK